MKSILYAVIAVLLLASPAPAQEPGTTGDPLVSKSYLDQFFRFRSLVVPNGDTLQLTPGAMIVIRSGRLRLKAPRGKSVIDLTDGRELPADTVLPANHLILVPESPGLLLEAKSMGLILALGLHPAR